MYAIYLLIVFQPVITNEKNKVSAFDTTGGSLLIQLFIFQQEGKWEKASLANKHNYLRKAFAGALAWKTRGVDGDFS